MRLNFHDSIEVAKALRGALQIVFFLVVFSRTAASQVQCGYKDAIQYAPKASDLFYHMRNEIDADEFQRGHPRQLVSSAFMCLSFPIAAVEFLMCVVAPLLRRTTRASNPGYESILVLKPEMIGNNRLEPRPPDDCLQ